MNIPQPVLKTWDSVGKIHGFLMVFFLIGTTLLVFVQVVLRYVFNAPLMGIEEFLLFPMAWLYMGGAAYASYHRAHIDCGIILLYIKRPMTFKIIKLLRSAVVLGVCLWLLKWSWWYLQYLIRIDKYSPLGYIRLLYVESSVFFGILIMTFYSFVEFVDWLMIFSGKKEYQFIPMRGAEKNGD